MDGREQVPLPPGWKVTPLPKLSSVVVKVTPPEQSQVGWRMKPGDAVRVEWGDGSLTVKIDADGAVLVTGSRGDSEAE